MKNKLIAWLASGFLFLVCAAIYSCSPGRITVLSQERSPSRVKRATVFESDGGATTGLITCVNIQGADEAFDPREGSVVGMKGRESASILWENDHKLIVILPKGANIYRQANTVGSVEIQYREL